MVVKVTLSNRVVSIYIVYAVPPNYNQSQVEVSDARTVNVQLVEELYDEPIDV